MRLLVIAAHLRIPIWRSIGSFALDSSRYANRLSYPPPFCPSFQSSSLYYIKLAWKNSRGWHKIVKDRIWRFYDIQRSQEGYAKIIDMKELKNRYIIFDKALQWAQRDYKKNIVTKQVFFFLFWVEEKKVFEKSILNFQQFFNANLFSCLFVQKVRHISITPLYQTTQTYSAHPYNKIINMIASPQIENSDSLDQVSQQYTRLKSGYSSQEEPSPGYRHDIMLKNLYKQELDELMRQKNEQKKMEKEREMQERQIYNDRANFSREADKMKDLAYKNYYQMLLNNQNNIAKNHTQLNYQRDNLKDKLITNGMKEEKIRSQQWCQAQQRRRQDMKKHYREDLDRQMHEKQLQNVNDVESKMKQQEEFKKITFTPEEVAKYERERKINQMNKYKEDLDRVTPLGSDKYRQMAGSMIVNKSKYTATNNDFNVYQQKRHDPMTNPMPFNIQNPYILREFMRKEQLKHVNPEQNIFSSK